MKKEEEEIKQINKPTTINSKSKLGQKGKGAFLEPKLPEFVACTANGHKLFGDVWLPSPATPVNTAIDQGVASRISTYWNRHVYVDAVFWAFTP